MRDDVARLTDLRKLQQLFDLNIVSTTPSLDPAEWVIDN